MGRARKGGGNYVNKKTVKLSLLQFVTHNHTFFMSHSQSHEIIFTFLTYNESINVFFSSFFSLFI